MGQLFEKFGLNVQLLVAQMVNFAILFFVLYKAAYKPILRVLDQRREKIESSIHQAKEIEERTKKMDEDLREKLAEGKIQAERMMHEAQEITNQARNDILLRTNNEVTAILEKARADVRTEKEHMMKEVETYVVQSSLMIVEKILSEKLDTHTKELLVKESLQEIPNSK